MYEKPSCHDFGTYRYISVLTGQEFLYLHVPVHTGTYLYILVHTILTDPVQVYRIPDAGSGRRRGAGGGGGGAGVGGVGGVGVGGVMFTNVLTLDFVMKKPR